MKVVVCGKGGSGKSTLSVLLARSFTNLGYRVLLVDADESNFGIPHLLGVQAPVSLLDSFGGKKGFKEKLNQPLAVDGGGIFPVRQRIEEIPEKCIASGDGIRMVSVGKIHHFGEGCACPMGVLARKFLASLEVEEKEMVIVDAEAGVEHFGRGVAGECDLILAVVDPTAESFSLAGKMAEMSKKAGRDVFFILNKIEPAIEAVVWRHIEPERVIGTIGKSDDIFMASLEGEKVVDPTGSMDRIASTIQERYAAR